MMDIAVTVFSFILGGGFLGFLQFLISRKDQKNDRFDAIVKELAEMRKDIRAIDEKGDLREAIESRVRILKFNDELLDKKAYTITDQIETALDGTDLVIEEQDEYEEEKRHGIHR